MVLLIFFHFFVLFPHWAHRKGKGNFHSSLFPFPDYLVLLGEEVKRASLSTAVNVLFLPSAKMVPTSRNMHIIRYLSTLSTL